MTGSDSAGRSGDPVTRRLVAEAIDRLMDEGPSLGRPLADRIAGSRLHNLKELRPGSSGASEVRILFIFDPVRNAVLLVAGDKSGRWKDPGAGRNGTAASSRSSHSWAVGPMARPWVPMGTAMSATTAASSGARMMGLHARLGRPLITTAAVSSG